MKTSKKLIGKTAFLRDIHCLPKQTGACKIVALSSKTGFVVVEWEEDLLYHKQGDVSAVPLNTLDVR